MQMLLKHFPIFNLNLQSNINSAYIIVVWINNTDYRQLRGLFFNLNMILIVTSSKSYLYRSGVQIWTVTWKTHLNAKSTDELFFFFCNNKEFHQIIYYFHFGWSWKMAIHDVELHIHFSNPTL